MKVYIAANNDTDVDCLQRQIVSYEDWCKASELVKKAKYGETDAEAAKLLGLGNYAGRYVADILSESNATDTASLDAGLSNKPEEDYCYAFVSTDKRVVEKMLNEWRHDDDWDDEDDD